MLSYLKNLFFFQLKAKSVHGLSGMEKADALFHNLVAENRVPGMAVTILRNGELVLQEGYGYADIEQKFRVDPKASIFRIASISKCITGLALGKMVEQGLIDWDASFYDYVPYYPQKKYDFTLRQLAAHTAGIRGYRGKEFALNKPFSIKDSIEVFQNDPLVFEPGKGYLYNSFDFVLLSLALQEASGVPFEDYVKEKVLDPLGLVNTFPEKAISTSLRDQILVAEPFDSAQDKLCQSYTKTAYGFKKAVEVNNFYKLAGGGYLSTASDIAQLGQAVLEQKLLKPKTYSELLTAQIVNGKSTYYGLGFQVSADTSGRPFVGHVGSSVGAYSNLFVYPEQKIVVSILVNCTDPKVQDVLDEGIMPF